MSARDRPVAAGHLDHARSPPKVCDAVPITRRAIKAPRRGHRQRRRRGTVATARPSTTAALARGLRLPNMATTSARFRCTTRAERRRRADPATGSHRAAVPHAEALSLERARATVRRGSKSARASITRRRSRTGRSPPRLRRSATLSGMVDATDHANPRRRVHLAHRPAAPRPQARGRCGRVIETRQRLPPDPGSQAMPAHGARPVNERHPVFENLTAPPLCVHVRIAADELRHRRG